MNKIEDKFEIIRDEEEHKNNSLRKYALLYKFYREMGVPKEEAKMYAQWNYKNVVEKPRR